MKWLVVALGLAAAYPLARIVRSRPRALEIVVSALAFFPFVLNFHEYLAISPISYEQYRGDADGLEVTIVDVLALALWFALPRSGARAPFLWPRLAWLAIALLSALAAPLPLFSLFSAWRIARGYLVLTVVARAAEDPRLGRACINGLAAGVIVSFVEAIYQRYGLGMHQCTGFFLHQNGLGMAVNLVFPIALAVLLGGQGGKLALATVIGAAVCVILTLSRGSLLMFGLGAVLVFVASLFRGLSGRKLKVALGAAALAAALLGYSANTIIQRFETAPESSEGSRELFVEAARRMLADHPFGIGLNQYSHVLDSAGYADRLHMDVVERTGIAHHIYWLTAAETGYLGIAVFLVLLAAPVWTGFRAAWYCRTDIRAEVVLGGVAGLVASYVQWTAEWGGRSTELTYLYWTVVGLIATMSRQISRSS